MIDGNPPPLEIAARVIQPETIAAIRRLSDYSLRGWRILDRWAINSPDMLRTLEAEGEVVLLGRLLEQQRIEQRAIDRQPVGMPELEALAMAKVQLELKSSNDAAAQLIKAVLRKSPNDEPRQRLRLVPRD